MSRKTRPGLPDIDVVHEVIRLADALAAAELRSGPAEALHTPRLPEHIALFDYLSQLPDMRMAELHALYWLGGRPSSAARAYYSLYQHALDNLDHGAAYLSAKPLSDALRRGLAKLDKLSAPYPARPVAYCRPVGHLED
jgi:hypothetical protein